MAQKSPWLLQKFYDTDGTTPLAGGKIFTYDAGTSTKKQTLVSESGAANANPIICDANGEIEMWLEDGSYKIVSAPSTDTDPPASPIDTWDDVNQADDISIFDTIALLKAAQGGVTTNVRVLGYYAIGDTEVRNYYWDGSSSATDNGGTVITPDAGGTGRWLLIYDGKVNVKWFGVVGDGAIDDTAKMQIVLDYCLGGHEICYLPASTYLITSTLDIHDGTQIEGDTMFAFGAGFSTVPKATTINFRPASTDDLFLYSEDGTSVGFVLTTAISGLYISGDSNSGVAFNLAGNVIYAKYSSIAINSFDTGFQCTGTINNLYENVLISGTRTECVKYLGSATTDVWSSCTFSVCPIGINITTSCVGLRFNMCLWEQIQNYGIDVFRAAQNITVSHCYCEDVPHLTTLTAGAFVTSTSYTIKTAGTTDFTLIGAADSNVGTVFTATGAGTGTGTANTTSKIPAADAAMFRVGHVGSATATVNQLIVIGGSFAGDNQDQTGSLFDINYSNGVVLGGFTGSRYVNLIKTDGTNTKDNCVICTGFGGISNANTVTDTDKIAGFYPNGDMNGASYNQAARFAGIASTDGLTLSGASAGVTFSTSSNMTSGAGSPVGSIALPVGSLRLNSSGGDDTTLYIKESGASTSLAITSITRVSTTATVITTAPHGITVGETAYVVISGAVEPDYNGTYTATSTGASTYTYTVANSPTTPATGTIVYNFGKDGWVAMQGVTTTPTYTQVNLGSGGVKMNSFSSPVEFWNGVATSGGGAKVMSGSGSPEGNTTANKGSLWMGGSGGAGISLYTKEAGSDTEIAITSITEAGGTGTVTTTVGHGIVDIVYVTISGAVESDYNVTALATPTGAQTFTYPVANSPSSPATGTIVYDFGKEGWESNVTSSMIKTGTGTPEAVINSGIGVLYLDSTGGSGTTLYVKESKGTVTAATAMILNQQYEIKTVGTTVWTDFGASASTIGVVFIATGAGTGTGDAYKTNTGWVAK